MIDDRVPEAGRAQAGVFTSAQARAEGWSDDQIRRRRRQGTWLRVLGRGLTVGRPPFGLEQRAWAAQLSVEGAVLSHTTAGALLGWPLDPGEVTAAVHLTGPAVRRSPAGIRLHRQPLTGDDLMFVRDGLVVTDPTRTAQDCLMTLPLEQAQNLWAWLVSRSVVDRHLLGHWVRTATGRPGVRQLLRLYVMSASGAVNPGEQRLHRLLRTAGLTGWEANARLVHEGRVIAVVDVLFRLARVVIELDGFRAHAGQDAFRRDRRRQNALVVAGYSILRITWDDLVSRPDGVISELRALLARPA